MKIFREILEAIHLNTDAHIRLSEAVERFVERALPVRADAARVDAARVDGDAAFASERRQGAPSAQPAPAFRSDAPYAHSMSESPEQYQERTSKESALALSLGVAPWSPAFQQAIFEMRAEVMRPRIEQDEEGNDLPPKQYTEEEADEIVRQAFQLAKAEANFRRT